MNKEIQLVLFDLDGTLLDTAGDMTLALNELRNRHQLPPLPLAVVRPHIGFGSRALLKIGFDIDENHPAYTQYLDEFLGLYHHHLTDTTQLFDGMEQVLAHLEAEKITWGIVTNKPSRFTYDLLKSLQLDTRAACIICGDSLSKRKPAPDQILHACELLKQDPKDCLYIGDTSIDVIASKAAGTKSLVTLYGYVGPEENALAWNADAYVSKPIEIIDWLKQ